MGNQNSEEKYEVIIKKIGREDPIETNIMCEKEIQEILMVIGKLNLRSAWGS